VADAGQHAVESFIAKWQDVTALDPSTPRAWQNSPADAKSGNDLQMQFSEN
jgi:hypothetical protein